MQNRNLVSSNSYLLSTLFKIPNFFFNHCLLPKSLKKHNVWCVNVLRKFVSMASNFPLGASCVSYKIGENQRMETALPTFFPMMFVPLSKTLPSLKFFPLWESKEGDSADSWFTSKLNLLYQHCLTET